MDEENLGVILGDCLDVFTIIPADSVELILTDIPYGQVNRKSNGLRNLDKGNADVLEFDLDKFLVECERVCKGSMYIFCASEQVSFIRAKMIELGFSTRHCIWEKTNPSPMNGQYIWLSSIENCIYGKKKRATFNEHCKGVVWRFPNGRNKIHPTEKPLKLFEYLVKTSTNEGDMVLDPCAGSCTTAIACINTNRNFLCVEKDPEFYAKGLERVKLAI